MQKLTCKRLTQPASCCCSEASLGTELSTQTPPVPHTQYLASPIQLHASSFLSTMAPPRSLAHRVYKDGCRVVLSALGEFTFKEGQHGGDGRIPEKISIVHPQLGVGGLEGMEGALPLNFFSFLQKVKKIAVVVVHLFKAGSMYPRLTTNLQSSFLIPAWEINLYHHAGLLGYTFGARKLI